jgi:hypothetical protein
MAILTSSIAYSGKNKFGTMVLRTVRGQLIASQYQPSVFNPKTLSQKNQRSRLSVTVGSFRSVRNVVETVLLNPNRHGSKYNKYVQNNIEVAPEENAGVWSFNWDNALMCRGSLANVNDMSYGLVGGNLQFDYSGAEYANQYSASDLIWGSVVFPSIEDSLIIQVSTRGVNDVATIDLTGFDTGLLGHVYIMATNPSERQCSVSQYIGDITL